MSDDKKKRNSAGDTAKRSTIRPAVTRGKGVLRDRRAGASGKNPALAADSGVVPVSKTRRSSHTTQDLKPVGQAPESERRKRGRDSATQSGSHRAAAVKPGTGSHSRQSGKRPAIPAEGGGIRLSLWIKFSGPVVLVILAVIVVWGNLVSRRTKSMLVNEIKKDGASGIQMLALQGRPMLDAYHTAKESEEYRRRTFWPVQMGFVTEEEFRKKTGLSGDEPAPDNWEQFNKALGKLALLRPFSFYDKQSVQNEILYAAVQSLDESRYRFVAGSQPSEAAEITSSDWLKVEEKLTSVRIGHNTIDLSRSGIQVYPGLLTIRGKGEFKVLVFQKDVPGGLTILALSAEVIQAEISSLWNSMVLVGALALLAALAVCVGIAMWVVRPAKVLIRDMNIVAGGNLEHKTRAHSGDEIGAIATEFNEMTRKLLVAHEAEKEAERLENELDMAREIQMKLLPPRVPRVKGLDMDAVYKPAKEVGGDYYDFFPIDKEHLGIIVADVSGKGIPGSMVMATTRTILRFVASGNTSAADTLAKTNAIVAADIKRGMFVTAFYLVFDARQRTLLCASAGHNPMVVVRSDGKVELINPNGIALGFDKGPIFQRTIKEEEVRLQSGDRIVLYTDGVVEAMNSESQEYTDERFYAFCKDHQKDESKPFIRALLADLDEHKGAAEQHDDITIVTIRVT